MSSTKHEHFHGAQWQDDKAGTQKEDETSGTGSAPMHFLFFRVEGGKSKIRRWRPRVGPTANQSPMRVSPAGLLGISSSGTKAMMLKPMRRPMSSRFSEKLRWKGLMLGSGHSSFGCSSLWRCSTTPACSGHRRSLMVSVGWTTPLRLGRATLSISSSTLRICSLRFVTFYPSHTFWDVISWWKWSNVHSI